MADSAPKPGAALTAPERARALAGTALARYQKLEPAHRMRLFLAAVLLLASFGALLWYTTRTDWRTLYAGLTSDDARQMAQELTTAGIPFDVSPDGSALRVPAQTLDKARLAVTAKGAPASGRMGFEVFDKPNWMGSEFDEKVNYQRALEGELERTIATLSAVESCRVSLVLPHDSLFAADERAAKASVVLRLRHRTLSADQAEAIANLVAGAVDGLRPENVVLVDAAGGGLLGRRSGRDALDAEEQQLAARLVNTLEPAVGDGNVRASVNVDYNPVSADEVDETYDPGQTATLSLESSEQTSAQASASGVPGTSSNAPSGTPPLYPPARGTQQNLKQQSATYGVSKRTRHTVEAPGGVRRLTAAVLINYRRVVQGKQTSLQPRSADDMKRLADLAQSAIGFDATRGDQVTVQELAFDEGAPVPAPGLATRVAAIGNQWQVFLRYGAVLLAFLAFFFLVARPAVRALAAPPAARAVSSAAAASPRAVTESAAHELPTEQHPVDPRKLHAQSVFEQVSETVKRDPAQSTRLIESWIRAD